MLLKPALPKGDAALYRDYPKNSGCSPLRLLSLVGLFWALSLVPAVPIKKVAWKWILLFSPLWGMLFFAFGFGPVLARTQEWLPILRNVAGFALGAIVAFLIPGPSLPPVLEE